MAYFWEFRNPCVGGCVHNQERSEKALISQNWLTLKLSAEAGNRNKGRVVVEKRKVIEFKKSNRKTKNVEPLRDFDSQNSF
jgi:hypothetical protein